MVPANVRNKAGMSANPLLPGHSSAPARDHFGKEISRNHPVPSPTPVPTLIPGTPKVQFSFLRPLIGQVKERRIINKSPEQPVIHLNIDVADQGLDIQAGQSVAIIPPSLEKPNWPRAYSVSGIHRDRHGNVRSLGLCVRRYVFYDAQGREMQRGLGSNYLCDLRPGERLKLYGPFGKDLLLPAEPNANLLMLATGTGIASYRATLAERYGERAHETGKTHVIWGENSGDTLFYQPDFERYRQKEGYRFTPVLSREGQKQRITEYIGTQGDELLNWLQDPKTYVYICGRDNLEDGLKKAFRTLCAKKGLNWDALLAELQRSGRWHCETKPLFWQHLRDIGLDEYAPRRLPDGKNELIKNNRQNRWPLFA
jgi:ferredoxin--NADP+ reductase